MVKDFMKSIYLLLASLILFQSIGLEAFASENSIPNIQRIYGEDRYETNYRLVKSIYEEAETVILVLGEVIPDALSASNLSCYYQAPLILTQSKLINDHTHKLLKELKDNKIIVVGGENTLSKDQFEKLKAYGQAIRISGSDRYETSKEVIKHMGSGGSMSQGVRFGF